VYNGCWLTFSQQVSYLWKEMLLYRGGIKERGKERKKYPIASIKNQCKDLGKRFHTDGNRIIHSLTKEASKGDTRFFFLYGEANECIMVAGLPFDSKEKKERNIQSHPSKIQKEEKKYPIHFVRRLFCWCLCILFYFSFLGGHETSDFIILDVSCICQIMVFTVSQQFRLLQFARRVLLSLLLFFCFSFSFPLVLFSKHPREPTTTNRICRFVLATRNEETEKKKREKGKRNVEKFCL